MLGNLAHDNAEVEDISIAVLQYADGAMGQVTSSVIHHGEEQRVLFQGEKAAVAVPWKVAASLSKENGFPEPNPVLEKELDEAFHAYPKCAYEGHTGEIDNLLTALEAGAAPLITGRRRPAHGRVDYRDLQGRFFWFGGGTAAVARRSVLHGGRHSAQYPAFPRKNRKCGEFCRRYDHGRQSILTNTGPAVTPALFCREGRGDI